MKSGSIIRKVDPSLNRGQSQSIEKVMPGSSPKSFIKTDLNHLYDIMEQESPVFKMKRRLRIISSNMETRNTNYKT